MASVVNPLQQQLVRHISTKTIDRNVIEGISVIATTEIVNVNLIVSDIMLLVFILQLILTQANHLYHQVQQQQHQHISPLLADVHVLLLLLINFKSTNCVQSFALNWQLV